MKELPHTHSCFVCGESNPRGFNLRSETDGKTVRTRFAFRSEHIGFKETVHGGLTATLLDEIMTWACAVGARRFAYCAELSVRFVHPIRPGQQIIATAEMVTNRRGRLFEATAEIKDTIGTVLATASGKYLPLKDNEAAAMASDFLDEIGWLIDNGRPSGSHG